MSYSFFTKIIIVTSILSLTAACSSEVKVDGGEPPPTSQRVTPSPTHQELQLSSSDSEALFNHIQLVSPAQEETYYFETRPTTQALWQYGGDITLSENCPSDKNVILTMTWQQLDSNGNVLTQTPVATDGKAFRVEPQQRYRLKLHATGFKDCASLLFSFYVLSTPITDHFLGEEALRLNSNHRLHTSQQGVSMYKDFYWTSTQKRDLYISYVSSGVSSRCEQELKISMEWLTLNSNGDIIQRQAVEMSDGFVAEANTHHRLRVWLKEGQNCDFVSISFGVDAW